jgi:hypothetical protein
MLFPEVTEENSSDTVFSKSAAMSAMVNDEPSLAFPTPSFGAALIDGDKGVDTEALAFGDLGALSGGFGDLDARTADDFCAVAVLLLRATSLLFVVALELLS